jgi:hypothetical protein
MIQFSARCNAVDKRNAGIALSFSPDQSEQNTAVGAPWESSGKGKKIPAGSIAIEQLAAAHGFKKGETYVVTIMSVKEAKAIEDGSEEE